ncbi:MAG: 23S rRNA (guanosine(2251)-2'-O)-methyltransferase RlmB [Flavobacteriales bacterium]|nr:23S rRNA (guanosine(2251)-2'-O)-methyltransferase RlmB [Flavobacteriales bacterium]
MEKNGIIHGVHPVLEAIRGGANVERILLRRGSLHDGLKEIRDAARAVEISLSIVPPEKLDRLVKGEHQGVVAFIGPVPKQDLDEVVSSLYERGARPLLLALDGVTDVRNIGAIARSAECLGAHALVVPQLGSARLGPDAVKSSAGALLRVPVCRVKSIAKAAQRVREHGLAIVACTEKASVELAELALDRPLMLVLGSEETGVSDAVLRMADDLARIPMVGRTGSLNVSVAAGVALYATLMGRSAE